MVNGLCSTSCTIHVVAVVSASTCLFIHRVLLFHSASVVDNACLQIVSPQLCCQRFVTNCNIIAVQDCSSQGVNRLIRLVMLKPNFLSDIIHQINNILKDLPE